MSETLEHRGHEIVIGGSEEQPEVLIDGESVPVDRIAEGTYASLIFPFMNFTSPDELAKAAIDHSPAYNGRRDV